MGDVEGALMKAFQARKKTTSTELTIEPAKSSSQQSGTDWLGFQNEQLDFYNQKDIISALSYILPYFSEGNPEDAQSNLLPFIRLLFPNTRDGDNSPASLKKNTRKSFFKPQSNDLTYEHKLKNFLRI